MKSFLILAAASAALVAGQACAESVRISTAGKSSDQVHAEVYATAKRLCAREAFAASRAGELQNCAARTTQATFAQAQTQGSASLSAH